MEIPQIIARLPDPLLPIRILAGVGLVIVISIFVWILRHLRKIETTISADNLVPALRGPRNNMILMASAITLIVVSLLLFLIFHA
jgi:hypothetical protein